MPRKRANGEGTRPYLRKDGRWQINFTHADLDGVAKRDSVYGKTASECREKYRAELARIEDERRRFRFHGLTPDQYEYLTVARYLDEWLGWVKANRAHNTWKRCRNDVKVHIAPLLGALDLTYLTPAHIEGWLARERRAGVTASTLSVAFGTLSSALRRAERVGLIERNPCRHVEAPRPAPARSERDIDPDAARRFLASARESRMDALFTVALALGLRVGEATGLTWPDVDFARGLLRVRRQLQREEGRFVLKETKGKRPRVVPLPAPLAARLAAHREATAGWPETRPARWRQWPWAGNDFGLVFTAVNGRPLHREHVEIEFRAVAARAGLAGWVLHDLRHACATLLFHQGVPERLVMEILGHSGIAITMDLYTHVIPAASREALAGMAQLLEEGGSDE